MSRRSLLRLAGTLSAAGTLLAGQGARAAAAESGGLDAQLRAIQAAAKPYARQPLSVVMFNNTYYAALKAQLDDFTTLTGIPATIDVYAEDAMVKKLAVELAAATGVYDVIYCDSGLLPQYARGKWVEPLEPYINNPQLTDKAAFDVADFLKAPWENGRWNNVQYGIPMFVGTQIFYYRKDILARYHLKPPDTFADLMAIAKKIHTKDVAAFAVRGGPGPNGAAWPFPILFLGFGARWFKDFPRDMHPTLDSTASIQACAYWTDLLRNYAIPNEATSTFDDVILAVSHGKTAMAIEGAPLAARILDPAKSEVAAQIGMSLVPKGPAGRFPPFTGHNWTIATAAKRKEAAWLFIQWAVSKSTFLKGAVKAGNVAVTRESVWRTPTFAQTFSFGGGPLRDLFRESLAAASAQYRPLIPEWAQIGDALSIELDNAVTAQKTPAKAMQDWQRTVYDLLKGAGYYTS